MKPKYLVIIILVIIASGAVWIYQSNQCSIGPAIAGMACKNGRLEFLLLPVHKSKIASSIPSPEFTKGGALGLPFSLKIGSSEDINAESLSVKLVSINDSRCPAGPNIQCIWAGTVLAKVELFQNSKSLGRTDVEIGKKNTVGNYEVEFIKVLPAGKAVNQADADYVLTFQISKI